MLVGLCSSSIATNKSLPLCRIFPASIVGSTKIVFFGGRTVSCDKCNGMDVFYSVVICYIWFTSSINGVKPIVWVEEILSMHGETLCGVNGEMK